MKKSQYVLTNTLSLLLETSDSLFGGIQFRLKSLFLLFMFNLQAGSLIAGVLKLRGQSDLLFFLMCMKIVTLRLPLLHLRHNKGDGFFGDRENEQRNRGNTPESCFSIASSC